MASPELSLDDRMVKLVAYTIVSVKRDAERAMPSGSGSIVVTDSMTVDAFTGWMIARYLQSDDYASLSDDEKLAEEDEKFLRVHYTVTHRWPREPGRYDEREIRVLKQLRDHMGDAARSKR